MGKDYRDDYRSDDEADDRDDDEAQSEHQPNGGRHPSRRSPPASLRPCTPNRPAQMAATSEMRYAITVHVSSCTSPRRAQTTRMDAGIKANEVIPRTSDLVAGWIDASFGSVGDGVPSRLWRSPLASDGCVPSRFG
jgi:hypothetical protein